MKRFAIILAALFLSGCAALPGRVNHTEYNGIAGIEMESAFVPDSWFWLGLFKDAKMPKDLVELRFEYLGGHATDRGFSLAIDVDGTETVIASGDFFRGYEPAGYQNRAFRFKDYMISLDLVRKMVEGERVIVRFETGKYSDEGFFHLSEPSSAKPGFRRFYEAAVKFNNEGV